MRLWHVDILPYLPRTQLLAQWRELNSVFAKEDRHVLINYVYEYPKEDLYLYTKRVMGEMEKRGFQIRTKERMDGYFVGVQMDTAYRPFDAHHDEEYLEICYYNLKEKYLRGQKDYSEEEYQNLYDYVRSILPIR